MLPSSPGSPVRNVSCANDTEGSQTGSHWQQACGHIGPQSATIVTGQGHVWPRPAPPGDGGGLSYKRGVTGSNPVAPTQVRALLASSRGACGGWWLAGRARALRAGFGASAEVRGGLTAFGKRIVGARMGAAFAVSRGAPITAGAVTFRNGTSQAPDAISVRPGRVLPLGVWLAVAARWGGGWCPAGRRMSIQ